MAFNKENSKSEYAQRLRDPRWQKKRLEILSRDNFMCRECFDKDSTLNVHHLFYSGGFGAFPWVTPNWGLITLCESCHETACHIKTKGADGDIDPLFDSLLILADTLHQKGITDILQFAYQISMVDAKELLAVFPPARRRNRDDDDYYQSGILMAKTEPK